MRYIVTLKSGTTKAEKNSFAATMSLATSGGLHFPNRHVPTTFSMSLSTINMEFSMSISEKNTLQSESRVRFITATPNFDAKQLTQARRLGENYYGSEQKITGEFENLEGTPQESGSTYTSYFFGTQSMQYGFYGRDNGTFIPSSTWTRTNLRKTGSLAAFAGIETIYPHHPKINHLTANWGLKRHITKETDPYMLHNSYINKRGAESNFESVGGGDFNENSMDGVTEVPASFRGFTSSYTKLVDPNNSELGVYNRGLQPYTYHLDGTGVDLVGKEYGTFKRDLSCWEDVNGNSRFQYGNGNDWWGALSIPDSQTSSFIGLSATGPIIEPGVTPQSDQTIGGGTEHPVLCLSVAGGKWNGWAKGSSINYYRTSFSTGVAEDVFLPGEGILPAAVVGYFSEAMFFIAMRMFHESKSIEPGTGFKKPTVITDSTSLTHQLNGGFQNPASANYIEGTTKTHIKQVHYSGNLYDHTATTVAHQGNTVSITPETEGNISPKLEYGMINYSSNNISGSTIGPNAERLTSKAFMSLGYRWVVAEQEELTKLPGVIYCRAAGNDNSLFYRAPANAAEDEREGVRTEGVLPGYRTTHFNNYVVYDTASFFLPEPNSKAHYMRYPGSTDVVICGSIKTNLVDKTGAGSTNSKINNIGHKNLKDEDGNFLDQGFNLNREVPDFYSGRGGVDVWAASEVQAHSGQFNSIMPGYNFQEASFSNPAYNITQSGLHLLFNNGQGFNQGPHSISPFKYRGGPYSNMGKVSPDLFGEEVRWYHVTRSSITHGGNYGTGWGQSLKLKVENAKNFYGEFPINSTADGGINGPDTDRSKVKWFMINTSSLFKVEGKETNIYLGNGADSWDGNVDGLTSLNQPIPGATPMYYTRNTANRNSRDGTSFATPNVAGIACLYMQVNPGARAIDFKKFMNFHGEKLSTTESISNNNIKSDDWKLGNNFYMHVKMTSANSGSYTTHPIPVGTVIGQTNAALHQNSTTAIDGVAHNPLTRPQVCTNATQSVAYMPFHSAFKTNKKATFRKK